MKKLKKALSLTLALALSLALAAPSFATDGYGPYSISDSEGATWSFSSAKVEKREIKFYGDNEKVATLILVQPGSTISFSDELGGEIELYSKSENLYIDLGESVILPKTDPVVTDTIGVDDLFTNEVVMGAIFIWTSEDYEAVYIIPDDGSSAQPEQPTEPAPVEPAPVESELPTTPTTPTTPATPDTPGSYTVKKGDTWSSICTNFYGDNAQRYALQKANKGVKLKEGAVIVLPEKLGKAALIPAPAAAAGEKLYTVKAGDSLGKIAAAEYGKVSEYKAIFERNADRLKNANTIYVGQVIVLPAKK